MSASAAQRGAGGHLGSSTAPAASRANTAPGSPFLPPGITSTRPVTYSNGFRRYGGSGRRDDRGRDSFGGVGFVALGYPLGYPGYLDDPGFGYDTSFADAAENPNVAANGYPGVDAPRNQPSGTRNDAENSDGLDSDGLNAAVEQAPPPYLAAPAPPHRRAPATAAPPLPEEDAITIVFKDGRPPEQIRNYALTRTMLYITAGRVRTVPVDQIDLAATEKINEKAGVEFQLPSVK